MLTTVLVWVVLLYPIWSPRMRRIRKRYYAARAALPDGRLHKHERVEGFGEGWEQDVPLAECFEVER